MFVCVCVVCGVKVLERASERRGGFKKNKKKEEEEEEREVVVVVCCVYVYIYIHTTTTATTPQHPLHYLLFTHTLFFTQNLPAKNPAFSLKKPTYDICRTTTVVDGSHNVSRWMTWLPISLKNAAKCDKWYQLQNLSITESLNANGAWKETLWVQLQACHVSVSNKNQNFKKQILCLVKKFVRVFFYRYGGSFVLAFVSTIGSKSSLTLLLQFYIFL